VALAAAVLAALTLGTLAVSNFMDGDNAVVAVVDDSASDRAEEQAKYAKQRATGPSPAMGITDSTGRPNWAMTEPGDGSRSDERLELPGTFSADLDLDYENQSEPGGTPGDGGLDAGSRAAGRPSAGGGPASDADNYGNDATEPFGSGPRGVGQPDQQSGAALHEEVDALGESGSQSDMPFNGPGDEGAAQGAAESARPVEESEAEGSDGLLSEFDSAEMSGEADELSITGPHEPQGEGKPPGEGEPLSVSGGLVAGSLESAPSAGDAAVTSEAAPETFSDWKNSGSIPVPAARPSARRPRSSPSTTSAAGSSGRC
jgi:hypothetical protein